MSERRRRRGAGEGRGERHSRQISPTLIFFLNRQTAKEGEEPAGTRWLTEVKEADNARLAGVAETIRALDDWDSRADLHEEEEEEKVGV